MIEKIKSPKDLKQLNINELEEYAYEARKFLIKNLSNTGGHLASNLGVVELTIALHYVFNSPDDKLIFDVGHQSYIHKMITGRADKFKTLRQTNGLSGFQKIKESQHDYFDVGHSSNSISIALGYGVTSYLNNTSNKGIAIIGDGSMTGGMAYEGLNNAHYGNNNLIVVFNDNEMSISKNVGYVGKKINKIRLNEHYTVLKNEIKDLLSQKGNKGTKIVNKLKHLKDFVKETIVDSHIFEDLGFNYFGPFDGHNLPLLISVFNNCNNINGPILIHVKTKKGKGYRAALNNPELYHGVGKFNIKTGKIIKNDFKDYSAIAGETITKLACKNKKVLAVTAAMAKGTGLSTFQKTYPDRFFDVGIAEAHAVTFTSSLSKGGYLPFLCIYSTFLQRAYDQLIEDVSLQNSHIIICIDRAGLVGADGETHQGIFDISFLSHIPNFVFMAPIDKNELIAMLEYATTLNQPVAIRYPRGKAIELEYNPTPLEKGKSNIIKNGNDFCIIALGNMMEQAMDVCNKFNEIDLYPTLINPRFISPIDIELINTIKNYKYVFVIEDNIKSGGYGEKLLSKLINDSFNGIFENFGFDTFVEHGSCKDLYNKYELDSENLFIKIKRCLDETR